MKDQRCYIRLSVDNLRHNFNVIKSLVGENTKVMPIIKADAYAHGAVEVSRVLEEYADIFAVAEIDEALALRNNGTKGEILILGYTFPDNSNIMAENSFIQSVMDIDYARELDRALDGRKKLRIHIMLDTGMHRFGFNCENDEALCEIEEISKLENLEIAGMFSHFCESDNLSCDFTDIQFARFNKVREELKARGVNIPKFHIANSAAILAFPETHLDFVRPGIILYGAYPSLEIKEKYMREHPDAPLLPVMTMCAKVAQIHKVKKGDTLGYGRTYTFERDSIVATISAGYADGIPRGLSNVGQVMINGKRANIVGNICMDLLMADITDFADKVKVGDEVTFWGNGSIDIDEVAKKAGILNYTIFTGVSKRVIKIYE